MKESKVIKSPYEFIRKYFPTTWAGWEAEKKRRKSLGMEPITLEKFERERWTRWIR